MKIILIAVFVLVATLAAVATVSVENYVSARSAKPEAATAPKPVPLSVASFTEFESPHAEVPAKYQAFHAHYAQRFIEQEGFGFYRTEPLVDFHSISRFGFTTHGVLKNEGSVGKLQRLELVSLLQHAQPRVYESPHLASPLISWNYTSFAKQARLKKGTTMEQFGNTPTRALDDFESAGLKRLRDGEDVVWQFDRAGVKIIGSLRAQKDCLACHKTKEGALLGALSYQIDPWDIFARVQE